MNINVKFNSAYWTEVENNLINLKEDFNNSYQNSGHPERLKELEVQEYELLLFEEKYKQSPDYDPYTSPKLSLRYPPNANRPLCFDIQKLYHNIVVHGKRENITIDFLLCDKEYSFKERCIMTDVIAKYYDWLQQLENKPKDQPLSENLADENTPFINLNHEQINVLHNKLIEHKFISEETTIEQLADCLLYGTKVVNWIDKNPKNGTFSKSNLIYMFELFVDKDLTNAEFVYNKKAFNQFIISIFRDHKGNTLKNMKTAKSNPSTSRARLLKSLIENL